MVYPSKRVALRGLVLLVTAAVLGLGLAIPGQVAAVDRGPVRVAPRTLPPTSALAVIRTITLGGNGLAAAAGGAYTSSTADDTIYITSNDSKVAAIDPITLVKVGVANTGTYPIGATVHRDDTVYIVNADVDTMTVIKGSTFTVSQTLGVPDEPAAVAVSRVSDDTLFISSRGSFVAPKITTLSTRTLSGQVSTSLGSSYPTPFGLGLTHDDSAYIATWPYEPRLFNSTTVAVTNLTSLGSGFHGVAVSADDTVYMTNESTNTVKSFRATEPGTVSSVSVPSTPQSVAIGHDGTVYVTSRNGRVVSAIDPVTNQVDDSVSVGTGRPYGIAVTRTGLMVTANVNQPTASIMATLSPTLTTTSAFAGEVGSLSIGGLPAGVTVDDTTVKSIYFGDDTVPWTRTPGTNTFTGAIPAGSGSVNVVVSLNGGNRAYAGSFTYAVLPPPPPTPADPPVGVTAVAGDRSASVSWQAPASSGSYAVSTYQVVASPGGRMCLTPGLSCTVDGLANGTTYTFTVKALTGAGWSESSAPSTAVVPRAQSKPSIVITGSRDGQRIQVTGSTTGFGMGAILSPWVKLAGQSAYSQGRVEVLVSVDGTFEWGRTTGRKAFVYMQTPDGSVRSNTVTIPAR